MPTPLPDNRRNLNLRTGSAVLPAAIVAILVLVPAGPSLTAAEPDAGLRREVAEYVSELASPLRSERVAAEQALLKLGPQVLELLPGSDEFNDQATRFAVRRLRIQLERVAAEESVRPALVSLRGTLSVEEIAARIEQQSGNRIDVEAVSKAAREANIDVDWQETPFWACIDSLTDYDGVAWMSATDEPGVRLVDTSETAAVQEAAADTANAFRIAIEPLTRRRGTLRAALRLTAEPRLRPLFVRIADADFVAALEKESLPLFSPQAVTELPMTDRGPARFSVLFRAPDDQKIVSATVRGRVNIHVAAAPVEVRFDDLSGQRVFYLRRGGVSVRLKRAEPESTSRGGHELVLRLAIAYDSGGPEFESHRTWLYHNECRLEHADGTRLAPESGVEITRQADGGAELVYRFADVTSASLRDWRLVYVAPTLLIDLPLEFEFEHVPVAEPTGEDPEAGNP